ncbi:MAG: LL-diaminopimelate aminotransferase [Planctomycetota bacterium]
MTFAPADRLRKLPPYLFAEIDKKKKAAIAAGRDVINLGIGDPDTPTPQFVIDELARQAAEPKNHQYALDNGLPEFRRAIAAWYHRRFRVELDPDKEIYPLIGSKEGIAHFPLAVLNPGDVALVPDPLYPPYRSGTIFAGGEPVYMKLLEKNRFLPDFSVVPSKDLARAKLMWLCYPNNPTAAAADLAFFAKAVDFARQNRLILAQDAAYSEVYYEEPSPSVLQVPGAKDLAIEFHSCSKTFNMTGWRIGWAAGNADLISLLGRLKTNLDSGIFQAVQYAAIKALNEGDDFTVHLRAMYRERRDAFCDGLRSIGWRVTPPKAAFYVWLPTPGAMSSTDCATRLLEEADIVMTPGLGFGDAGEGYIRAALTVDVQRLREATRRISGMKWS